MASGQLIQQTRKFEHWYLIDAEAAATNNGVWIDSGAFDTGSIDVVISNTATVQIRGSDAPTRPADTAHGNQIGTDITASSIYSIQQPPRWLKARVSAYTNGQVDVWALLRFAHGIGS